MKSLKYPPKISSLIKNPKKNKKMGLGYESIRVKRDEN